MIPAWDDNQQQFHDKVLSLEDGTPIVRLDEEDIELLAQNGYSLDDYHDLFVEAFAMHRDDPNNELLPAERYAERMEYFDLLEAIGYDMEDFRWDEWRAWMGYE